jgi:hypothetical protein
MGRSSISIYINSYGMTTRRRADKEIVTRILYSRFVCAWGHQIFPILERNYQAEFAE